MKNRMSKFFGVAIVGMVISLLSTNFDNSTVSTVYGEVEANVFAEEGESNLVGSVKMCLPEPQRWIYKPSEWHYKPSEWHYKPPVLKRVHPCVPEVKEATEIRPKPMVFPLHREPPESSQFLALYELKF